MEDEKPVFSQDFLNEIDKKKKHNYLSGNICNEPGKTYQYARQESCTVFKYEEILSYEFPHHYIRKNEISLVSTKENPCSPYPLEICKDIEIHKLIKNDFNCTISIFSSGGHLNMNESLSECNNQVILEALKFRRMYTTDCPSHPPCDKTGYLSRSSQKLSWGNRFV